MSDGLLLGFVVGAGVTFQEDAHYGEILGSGDGWWRRDTVDRGLPDDLASRQLLRPQPRALGSAERPEHWRGRDVAALALGLAIALAGPLLALTNHLMAKPLHVQRVRYPSPAESGQRRPTCPGSTKRSGT